MLECYWMPLVDTAFVQLALNNYEKLSKKLKRIWLNVNVCVCAFNAISISKAHISTHVTC